MNKSLRRATGEEILNNKAKLVRIYTPIYDRSIIGEFGPQHGFLDEQAAWLGSPDSVMIRKEWIVKE